MATAKGGRPKGARNKLNATDEIKKALNRGQGLVELKQYLWDMMNDPKVSELQKSKFTQMYLDIMKYVHTENLKIEHPKDIGDKEDSSKEISKGQNTENTPTSSEGKVSRITFGK